MQIIGGNLIIASVSLTGKGTAGKASRAINVNGQTIGTGKEARLLLHASKISISVSAALVEA